MSYATGEARSVARALPTAVVLNLFYTGLGIARSLGEHGVPVVGLTAERGIYGSFSRYVRAVSSADSQRDPETLLRQLIELGKELGHRAVLFPTRDHDLVFLDRFRHELEPYFYLVIPGAAALQRSLNKWETYLSAMEANVPSPRCWLVESPDDVRRVSAEVAFPCVLKPLAAHHWRLGGNWELVGGRKAVSVDTPEVLLEEYTVIARADRRALIQEQIPGADDCLIIAACYVDKLSRYRAGFNTQKLVQTPPGFGTGCIVQSANRPELFERTTRLLQAMEFTGIAEVEYKWDATDNDYKLIEVNPRPWDQHRIGPACGVDLMYLAYCDHAGLPVPDAPMRYVPWKWIAEDAFLMAVLRLVWRRERGLTELFRQARGKRLYAIWSARDPLPFIVYVTRLLPTLLRMAWQSIRALPARLSASRQNTRLRVSR